MRLTKEQALANRSAIVDAAGRLFRERGFDAVTVADLMEGAGFTHGGFYNHFPSKEALAVEVASASLRRATEGLPQAPEGAKALAGYVSGYLSPTHRDDPARGCTLGALAADAGRQGKEMQACFAEAIAGSTKVLAEHLAKASGTKGKRARAQALRTWSEMVGALVLARAVVAADPELSDAILEASRKGCTAALEGAT
jgi:TetR/AcrR family transcriptional repressor of nem operon